MTGFRLAYGGAQEYYGVVPDLAVYGKALTCGFSLAAIAGRADVMATADPARKGSLDYAGALGHAVGQRPGVRSGDRGAGRAPASRAPTRASTRWASACEPGSRGGPSALGVPVQVLADGPIAQVFFIDPVADLHERPRAPRGATAGRRRASRSSACRRGIFTFPGTKLYLSLAHTDADIDWTLDVMEESLRAVA